MQKHHTCRVSGAIVALTMTIAGSGFMSADSVAEPLELRGDNTIIVERSDQYAAAYLQQYLLKGVMKHPDADKYDLDAAEKPDRAASPGFPVLKLNPADFPADKNIIVVAPLTHMPEGVLDPADRQRLGAAKPNSVLLKREGNLIIIAKRDQDHWALAHIRVFLDRCAGIRVYAPTGANGLEWVSMPSADYVTINELNSLDQPYLAKTTFSTQSHERNRHWLRMNTILSEGLDLRASHTIINYFPTDVYYDKYPQVYPMGADGARPMPHDSYWVPCLADPELSATVAMEQVRQRMSRQPAPGYLSFGIMDTDYSCKCPVCQASMKAHGGQASNLWYDFLNRVARQCQQEFPGLYLTSYIYSNVRRPPVGMRIEPNIVVDYVIKSYNFSDKNYWNNTIKAIKEYADLGARWVVHDWNFSGVTPRIYNRQEAALLQWGINSGMLGIYSEWSPREYWYLDGANYWILFQLHSDPYQETDFLWRRYCQDMFGAGWVPMYRFFDMFAQNHVVADAYFVRHDWPRQDAVGFSVQDTARQRNWLEEAIAATEGDAMIQRRLEAIERYFRAHELLVAAVSKPGRIAKRLQDSGATTDLKREALAFYVNDDASAVTAFDDYYDNQRTIAPDSNEEDSHSSLRFSYRSNYSRALGIVLRTTRQLAMKSFGATKKPTAAALRERVLTMLRANLPTQRDAKRTAEIEALQAKIISVPRAAPLPVLDGDLSDEVWKDAAVLKDFTLADLMIPSREGNETEGRIMRVGDSLVLGITCQQERGIWAKSGAEVVTGAPLWRESSCEFFLSEPAKSDEKSEFAQYVVNAFGSFRGFGKAIDNRKDVQCATKVAEDGKSYVIEIAIPLKVEGLYDYTAAPLLEFNIQRSPFYANTFNPHERIGWAPIFFTASLPESRGLIVME